MSNGITITPNVLDAVTVALSVSTQAQNSATAAAASAASASSAATTIVANHFYGLSPTVPTTRPDFSPSQDGDIYYNTTSSSLNMRVGGAWGPVATSSSASALLAGNNLLDLSNIPTARSNLGLGSAAVLAAGAANGAATLDSGAHLPAAQFSASTAGVLSASSNLSDLASAKTARSSTGLNIDRLTTAGNSNYTILATDRIVAHSSLTAARTDTLPAASAMNPGGSIIIADIYGVVTASNTIIIQRTGADTVNGGTSFTLSSQWGSVILISDGVSKWVAPPTSVTPGTGLSLAGNTLSITSQLTGGSAGAATSVPVITYNAQGQLTAVTTATPSVTWSGVTGGTPFNFFMGAGDDGNVTVSTSVTLTRDMFYNNLTISAGAAINPAGYRIYVAGTLDISAAPAGAFVANGGAGSGLTHGTQAGGPGTIGGSGNAGSDGSTALGASPANQTCNGGAGGPGGAGSNTGGLAPVATPTIGVFSMNNAPGSYYVSGSPVIIPGGIGGAAGGGAGAGQSGGGGGAGGGVIIIIANVIARGSNATVGIFQAKGGNGGTSPGTLNDGGGGGGGGGWIMIVFQSRTGSSIANAIDVSGGAGGTGIASGTGGSGGSRGGVHLVDFSAATITKVLSPAAGSAGSGVTGGAGAVGQTAI